MTNLMRRAGAAAAMMLLPICAPASAAWHQSVVHVFNGHNGANPYGGVITDAAGNIYGTTYGGGKFGNGTVFMLSPPAAGKLRWTETVLHSFDYAAGDGAYPEAGLVQDASGNLYGTTVSGGAFLFGSVFKLSPPAYGKTAWTETLLHSFGGSDQDGYYPDCKLIVDAAGNVFGSTFEGGVYGYGTVFQLTPNHWRSGEWSEAVLHSFGGPDGSGPVGMLVADKAGNIYGTTETGGAAGNGAVFELAKPQAGATEWTGGVLLSFDRATPTGASPLAGVIFDGQGDLIGTAYSGGKFGAGLVFLLTPPRTSGAPWRDEVLHSFKFGTGGGAFPASNVSIDGAGNLYGTTQDGGKFSNGTVFKLSPPEGGRNRWSETVLHSFPGASGSEPAPYGGLTPDSSGNLYGTTYDGGRFGYGTVFKVTP